MVHPRLSTLRRACVLPMKLSSRSLSARVSYLVGIKKARFGGYNEKNRSFRIETSRFWPVLCLVFPHRWLPYCGVPTARGCQFLSKGKTRWIRQIEVRYAYVPKLSRRLIEVRSICVSNISVRYVVYFDAHIYWTYANIRSWFEHFGPIYRRFDISLVHIYVPNFRYDIRQLTAKNKK